MKAKIILALDVDNLSRAKYFINRLYPQIKTFKVGSLLFTSCGGKIIDFIHNKGGEVFLDLKFHDIPNTVSDAVRAVVRLKVKMFTLHIAGGQDMLKAAVRAAKEESRRLGLQKPLLIGVTVLTSQKASPAKILSLAKLGLNCGLEGVVCSATEAALLRKKIKRNFIIITPGIRPDRFALDDQKRTATVNRAIKAGSNFLVVGRPVLKAKDPVQALKELR